MDTNPFKVLGELLGMIDGCNKGNSVQQASNTCDENFSENLNKESLLANDVGTEEFPKKKCNLENSNLDNSECTDDFAIEDIIGKEMDYRKEIVEYYEVVTGQLVEVIKEQRSLNSLIENLKDSTILLGDSVRKSNMFEGIEKLILLWRIVNKSSDELSQYYSQILYEALLEFGVEAIIPQAGDDYCPEIHQKEDQSMLSNKVVKCEKYNWGWKLNDTILTKAVIHTSCEEDTNGSIY